LNYEIQERIVVKELGKLKWSALAQLFPARLFHKNLGLCNYFKLIKYMVPPALHEAILYSGIKALRYGNLLPNKYRVTESGNDLVAVSISDLK